MCGIFGILVSNNLENMFPKINSDNLEKILGTRGGDHIDVFRNEKIFLYRTRLAIECINTDTKFDEQLPTTFNGEIYNYKNIAEKFHIQKPTELKVINSLGRENYLDNSWLNLLDGVFSIARYIKNKNILLLARDPFGVKPLFYTFGRVTKKEIIFLDHRPQKEKKENEEYFFAFSSNPIPFFSLLNLKPIYSLDYFIELASCSGYHQELTPFQYIYQVIPSYSYLIKNNNKGIFISKKKFIPYSSFKNKFFNTDEELLKFLIESALVKRFNHSEVYPLANFLSGGIDSSIIAIIAKNKTINLKNFFFSDSDENPDFYWVNYLSNKFDLPLYIKIYNISDIIEMFPQMIYSLPGYMGLTIYITSQFIKSNFHNIKIAFSGEGADEVFKGYVVYRDPIQYANDFKKKILYLARIFPNYNFSQLPNFINFKNPEYLWDHYLKAPLIQNHLIPFDFGTMAKKIEMRLPFLDLTLINFLEVKPSFRVYQKIYLKKYLNHLTNRELPKEFFSREKNAFPHSLTHLKEVIESMLKYEVSHQYFSNHPLYKLGFSKFEIFIYDLNYYFMNSKDPDIIKSFNIYKFYKRKNIYPEFSFNI